MVDFRRAVLNCIQYGLSSVVIIRAKPEVAEMTFERLRAWAFNEFLFEHPEIVVGPLETEKLKEQGVVPDNSYNAEYDVVTNNIRFGTDWKPDSWKNYVYPGVETELDVVIATLCHEINHAILLQFIGLRTTQAMDNITYDTVWDGGTRI